MKTRLVVVLHLLIGALCWPTLIIHAQDSVVGPSRADMDRLLTDVGNHNRKLGELITSRDLSQIKQEAQYLREDVKSLARKSTGLSVQDMSRLQQRTTNVVELTQELEKNAQKADYAALKADYDRLQAHISTIHGLAANKPGLATAIRSPSPKPAGASAGRNPDMDRLLTDITNHHRKLGEVIASKDPEQVKQEATYLREDVKSLARKSTGLSENDVDLLQQKMNNVIDVTDRLQRNVEKSDYTAVRADYQKLQPLLSSIRSIAGEKQQVRELNPSAPVEGARAGLDQLVSDINNHNVRLREVIFGKNFPEIQRESFQLREDVKALFRKSGALAPAEQTRLERGMTNVVDLTERLESNANRSDPTYIQSLYQRLQPHIKNIESIAEEPAQKPK